VDELGAELDGHRQPRLVVRPDAPADPITRIDQERAPACARERGGRGHAGCTGADDSNVDQCGFTPAARTAFCHFTSSALMCAPKASGVLPTGCAPCESSRLPISAPRRIFTTSAFRRFTTDAGVAAGAKRPYHELASKPLIPASVIVGTLGSIGMRFSDPTARALSLPALM